MKHCDFWVCELFVGSFMIEFDNFANWKQNIRNFFFFLLFSIWTKNYKMSPDSQWQLINGSKIHVTIDWMNLKHVSKMQRFFTLGFVEKLWKSILFPRQQNEESKLKRPESHTKTFSYSRPVTNAARMRRWEKKNTHRHTQQMIIRNK